MHKVGSKIILWVLIVALLLYTATRTLHFLQRTFPPDQGYVAFLALAAFDIGVLGWLYFATSAARGDQQRALAYGMIFVCGLGVVLSTIADTLLGASGNGMVKGYEWVEPVGLWATLIIIVLNVFAGILVHLADPEHLKHARTESLHSRILAKTHEQMESRAEQIAPRVAEALTEHWVDTIVQELTGNLPKRHQIAPATIAREEHEGTRTLPEGRKKKE